MKIVDGQIEDIDVNGLFPMRRCRARAVFASMICDPKWPAEDLDALAEHLRSKTVTAWRFSERKALEAERLRAEIEELAPRARRIAVERRHRRELKRERRWLMRLSRRVGRLGTRLHANYKLLEKMRGAGPVAEGKR